MNKLSETFRRLRFNVASTYGSAEFNLTASYVDIEIDIINNGTHISLYGQPGDYSLGIGEIEELTPERLDCIIALIDNTYMKNVYMRRITAIKEEMEELRAENARLQEKNHALTERLYYALGAAAAQDHFNALAQHPE